MAGSVCDHPLHVISCTGIFFSKTANKEEETVYSDVKVRSKTTEKTADTNRLLPDKKTNSRGRCYQQVACCLGILCVILLLGIIAVCVYKNQILTTRNQELETQNQDLESQRNNLTEQIQNKWNELNVSRAQWSIDAYCPKPENQNRQCKACQDGWILSESSCYGINNPDVPGQKTWEEARENCRGKISDLVVKLDQKEKEYVDFNWGELGYWIGLRVEAGNWMWINGTFLKTQDYWDRNTFW
ncbi:C-type lectin domain family 10 member A-like isoform X3 [Micropterus salmoides]|uniref:C-type lectin domain family 10 member A-like isoform X3 n=1 Tax=Micropterus salmoides TaxID=27706 RepID=UPI0018EE04B3|nr:C-type lectin domain family 10 member A-like isoform X3 [Micropterus salmoides]